MRGTARAVTVAGITAAALLAAGCGGGSETVGGSKSIGKTGGSITVRGCNPRNPLVPSNTNEPCGGNVIEAVFAKLVHYNAQTAAPENDIAESIETTDNQNFTVRLVKGYTFHDGTEVKAKNFVDAWNYAAYGVNAQLSYYFFEPIDGFAETQCADADCKTKPKAETMAGLKVVDDYTFTIKTTEKVSNLPVRLGCSAFSPLPDSFFKDPKAFGEHPIGAGPFKFDSSTENQEIKLSRFADYSGKYKGSLDGITFKIYRHVDSAYNDVLANELDITDEVPSSALIDNEYKRELPDRNIQKAVGTAQTITFPPAKVDPNYAEPKVRQAISMAINRDEIVKQIFNNTRKPATGWVSPVVDGYRPNACGEFCKYHPARAKALLQEAGGFTGAKITLSYNADASHKEWTEATCNSLKKALGVDCVATPVVDFSTLRAQISARKVKGMFRTSWQMDYPSIENWLAPLYRTGVSTNDGDYSSQAFDKLLDEAAAATDSAAANAKYQEAEALLARDMPAIPMWYSTATFGWSEKVTNVKITPFGTVDFASLQMK